jgi:hypothetical protein
MFHEDVKERAHWNGEEQVAMYGIQNFFKNPDFDWNYSKYKLILQHKFKLKQLTNDATKYRGVEDAIQCGDYNQLFTHDVVSFRADNYFALKIASNPFYR